MTLKFSPIDHKCHKSFYYTLKNKRQIPWWLVSFIFRTPPVIRGLKIDLWIVVTWSKTFWGSILNRGSLLHMWTFPLTDQVKQGLLLNTKITHLFVLLSVIQKLQVIFQVFRGPRLQNSVQGRNRENHNSLENRVPQATRYCRLVTAPPSSFLCRSKARGSCTNNRLMERRDLGGKYVWKQRNKEWG